MLTRRRPLLRKSRLRPISAKRRRVSALYRELRLEYLTKNPRCKVCGNPSSQIHHKAGRVGEKLTDTKDFLAVCFECHDKIHHNPAWAYAKDYLIRTAPELAKPTQHAGLSVASR